MLHTWKIFKFVTLQMWSQIEHLWENLQNCYFGKVDLFVLQQYSSVTFEGKYTNLTLW